MVQGWTMQVSTSTGKRMEVIQKEAIYKEREKRQNSLECCEWQERSKAVSTLPPDSHSYHHHH